MTMKLTPAIIRMLSFLHRFRGWHLTADLERARWLEPDDIVVLPSLKTEGFVEVVPSGRLVFVRLAAAGERTAAACAVLARAQCRPAS